MSAKYSASGLERSLLVRTNRPGKKDRGCRGVGIGYNYQRSHNPQCTQLLSGSTVGLLGGGLEIRF